MHTAIDVAVKTTSKARLQLHALRDRTLFTTAPSPSAFNAAKQCETGLCRCVSQLRNKSVLVTCLIFEHACNYIYI